MDICETENGGDGCGGVFPLKVVPGLCAKCAKLSTLQDGSPEHSAWLATKQCTSCGLAWKNLQGTVCGRCSRPPPCAGPPVGDAEQLVHTAVETSRVARAHAVDGRMNKKPQPAPALHTTAGLNAAKNNTQTGENKYFIHIECRIKAISRRDQDTNLDYGKWGKPWGKDDYLSEVLDDALITLNARWARTEGMSLLRDEVEFRWSGNKIFHSGDMNDTIGNIYNNYLTGDMAAFYQPADTKTKKAASGLKNQLSMALEIYVDKPAFVNRRNIARGTTIESRKRSATTTTQSDIPVPKRRAGATATDGILQSSFIRTAPAASGLSMSTTVQLTKAHTTCDTETGQVGVTWPDRVDPVDGLLGQEVFSEGETKRVYQLSLGGELHVAKRFFEIGSGTEVTALENRKYLENELIRLKLSAWFLAKFKAHAKDCAVDIATDIEVSDGFLVREVGTPSPASDRELLEDAFWLVEPRRTKSVQKFSGTLIHPNRRDKVGRTLAAFSHFVYEYSRKELVFADIQGSPMAVKGRDTLILFDLMTHSLTSDSGIGDHGIDGIKSFVSQHRCNELCRKAKLTSFNSEDEPESDASEGSGDEE